MCSFPHFSRGMVWIGLHDMIAETKFIWEDGSSLNTKNFTNWSFNQGQENHGEDCVAMEGRHGRWHDKKCIGGIFVDKDDQDLNPYICQYATILTLPATSMSIRTTKQTLPLTTTILQTKISSPATTSTTATISTTKPIKITASGVMSTTVIHKTTTITTSPPTTVCPAFNCNLDCGLDGYKLDGNGCSLCTCDS